MNRAKLILLLILIFAYGSRLWRLSFPPDYYFDEVYHAFTAEAYSRNDPKGYEWWHKAPEGLAYEWLHPPLAKLLQGGSIHLLGDVSFAWRLPSAIFGLLTIVAVYYLTQTLTKREDLSLLAAFIASLDGLLLTQSRIAMNDIFVTFFILIALIFHWQYLTSPKQSKQKLKWMLLSGMAAGLALASKWSGLFVLGIFGMSEVVTRLTDSTDPWLVRLIGTALVFVLIPGLTLGLVFANFSALTSDQGSATIWWIITLMTIETIMATYFLGWKKTMSLAVSFVLLPLAIYVLSFGQFWLQDRDNNWQTFVGLHHQIWWYQTNLEATHPWQSRPIQWVLNLKPVWYHVQYLDDQVGNIYALANPGIAWFGLVAVVWLLVQGLRLKKGSYVYLVVAYCMVWIPWVASPRIMFYYHYTPAIALLSIILAIGLGDLFRSQYKLANAIGGGVIVCLIASFVYFYPHWTGLPVSKQLNSTYYWFESWKP